MNEFLLLALVLVYLAVSYAPTSQPSKEIGETNRSEQPSDHNSETDPATGR